MSFPNKLERTKKVHKNRGTWPSEWKKDLTWGPTEQIFNLPPTDRKNPNNKKDTTRNSKEQFTLSFENSGHISKSTDPDLRKNTRSNSGRTQQVKVSKKSRKSTGGKKRKSRKR